LRDLQKEEAFIYTYENSVMVTHIMNQLSRYSSLKYIETGDESIFIDDVIKDTFYRNLKIICVSLSLFPLTPKYGLHITAVSHPNILRTQYGPSSYYVYILELPEVQKRCGQP
jgi:hypothetical protein